MTAPLLLLAMVIPAAASEPKIEGKPLSSLVRELRADDPKKPMQRWHAIETLCRARFRVGTNEQAMSALANHFRTNGGPVQMLGKFGPMAKPLLSVIRTDEEHPRNTSETVGRLLVRMDGHAELLALDSTLRALVSKWKRTGGSMESKTYLIVALANGGLAGLRAEGVDEHLISSIDAGFSHVLTISHAVEDLPPGHPGLQALAVMLLTAADKEVRVCGIKHLAETRQLDIETFEKLMAAVKRIPKKLLEPVIVQRFATLRSEDPDALLKLFGKWRSWSGATAAWSEVGIARLRPDQERDLGRFERRLRSRDDVARVAAADGLLRIGEATAPLRAALVKALGDPDLRVRWRAGVILLRLGKLGDVEPTAVEAVRLGIWGPDDRERVLVFDALRTLSKDAFAPLVEHVEPWTKVPYPRIASRARSAINATKPKDVRDD